MTLGDVESAGRPCVPLIYCASCLVDTSRAVHQYDERPPVLVFLDERLHQPAFSKFQCLLIHSVSVKKKLPRSGESRRCNLIVPPDC